jgi:hypothetical protein
MKKLRFAKFLCLLTVFILGGNTAALATIDLSEYSNPDSKSNLVIETKKTIDSQNFENEEIEIEDESEDLDGFQFLSESFSGIYKIIFLQIKRKAIEGNSKRFGQKKVPFWLFNLNIRI